MSLFHTELDKQISEIVASLKKNSLQIPENWHLLDYKTKAELVQIENEDIVLIKKIRMLHEQGKDISSLNTRILQLCNEIIIQIHKIREEKNTSLLDEEGRRMKAIIDEISQIYSRELSTMKHESKKLSHDNAIIQNFKARIIDMLNKPTVFWQGVESELKDMLCTRELWKEFMGTDLVSLTTHGGKYEQYNNVYRNTLLALNAETDRTKQMKATRDGSAWFHIETSPDMPNKSSFLGFSFKRYVTVDLSSAWDLLKYLLKLANALRQVGLKNKDQVTVKVPGSFLSFVKHHDSIVIHYHNPSIKSEIEYAVRAWLANYKIKSVTREYDRVEHARDVIGTSFSDNVAQTATKLMMHNYGKMSNEALTVAGINYAFKISKDGL